MFGSDAFLLELENGKTEAWRTARNGRGATLVAIFTDKQKAAEWLDFEMEIARGPVGRFYRNGNKTL